MITPGDALLLAAAGVLAGVVGTAGAITSLVSFPALLAVGLSARSANVANIVALTACLPGAALASRPELTGHAGWLARHMPIAAAGGVAGAVLLLSTPARVFAHVVPFLVAAGALLVLVQPRLPERPAGAGSRRRAAWLAGAVFAISLYSGYFGAGSGVMLLGLLLVVMDGDLPTANALKNVALGATTVASGLVLVAFASVRWAAVLPLFAGLFAGSTLGPRVTRALPPQVLRFAVALVGLGLAVQLWLTGGR